MGGPRVRSAYPGYTPNRLARTRPKAASGEHCAGTACLRTPAPGPRRLERHPREEIPGGIGLSGPAGLRAPCLPATCGPGEAPLACPATYATGEPHEAPPPAAFARHRR